MAAEATLTTTLPVVPQTGEENGPIDLDDTLLCARSGSGRRLRRSPRSCWLSSWPDAVKRALHPKSERLLLREVGFVAILDISLLKDRLLTWQEHPSRPSRS